MTKKSLCVWGVLCALLFPSFSAVGEVKDYGALVAENDALRAQLEDLRREDDLIIGELYPAYVSYFGDYIVAQREQDPEAMDFAGRNIAASGIALSSELAVREELVRPGR